MGTVVKKDVVKENETRDVQERRGTKVSEGNEAEN
jgi:hypothetical protein